MKRARMVTVFAACLFMLVACGQNAGPAGTTSPATTAQSAATAPCGTAAAAPRYEHVVWLIMENHGRDQVVANPSAPYFNSLIDQCGLATNYHAVAHPSLPNYIAMTSGGVQGINNDGPPSAHPVSAASIFSQLGEGKWRSLSQAMPANCYLRDSGLYVPRHNPATYYIGVADQCSHQAVPLADPPALPDLSAAFTFIAPDQRSNTHDTDVAYGDKWLASFVPKVLNSPQYASGRTVLMITYDEDEDRGNAQNPVATVVIAPSTQRGTRNATYFTHYSLLRTTEELLGLATLGQASDAASMRAGFNL